MELAADMQFNLNMSASRNSEEENILPVLSDEALEEANNYIKEAFDILKRETIKVRKEKEAFDDVAKKLEHVHFSKMLKLNVGGQLFSTSLQVRCYTPCSQEDLTQSQARTGLIVPEDKIFRRELLAEAEFYQIEGIIDELTARPFRDSVILSSDQRQTLINWLKETRALTNTSDNLFFGLIYRASRDGWGCADFHSCCNYKGPTVTVVKSGNYIFVGYTELQWEHTASPGYRKATDSFMFSLVNPSGRPPTKIPLIAGREETAIHFDNGFGPIFGSYDLLIYNAPNSNNCSAKLNNSYQCPTGENAATFLTGNDNFKVDEMEVFGFEK
ncbi:hypothetical protein ACROYT_G032237 [Oculina patagonica]